MDAAKPTRWTEAQAERQLRSLELFGMRFGLDRMRRMMTVLGSPEQSRTPTRLGHDSAQLSS